MKRKAFICCSKCRHVIAEICVEKIVENGEDGEIFDTQTDELRQYFGIPSYYCGECISESEVKYESKR